MKFFLTVLLALFFIIILLAVPLWLIKGKREKKTMQPLPILIRKPVVAGSFYPGDSGELNSLIDGFLSKAKKTDRPGRLKILLVPHAGLTYSGQTAAWGFAQLQGKDYSRVILLGVSHRHWFDYAAVYKKGEWETPLGRVVVDEGLANSFLDEKQKIIADDKPHLDEHSLEVELVFLQKVLSDFKIVPVLVSQISEDSLNNLAEKISRELDEETILVISSDLSHYPSWETANKADNEVIEAILSGRKEIFEKAIENIESRNYAGLETGACGQSAISVGLKVGEILGIKDFEKLYYENSGDLPTGKAGVSGDKGRVVGYAAIGGWADEGETTALLNEEAKKEALQIVRKTLQVYLGKKEIPAVSPKSQILFQPLGAFVTLRKNDDLRGCIGSFEPTEPLYRVIQKMAMEAATSDPRFLPVTAEELKEIKIEISVMTPRRKINNWQEVELGKHGVVIKKGFRSGTFLPQVATETGWSKEEFLGELCTQKAGLPFDCYKDQGIEIYVFEAEVFAEK